MRKFSFDLWQITTSTTFVSLSSNPFDLSPLNGVFACSASPSSQTYVVMLQSIGSHPRGPAATNNTCMVMPDDEDNTQYLLTDIQPPLCLPFGFGLGTGVHGSADGRLACREFSVLDGAFLCGCFLTLLLAV